MVQVPTAHAVGPLNPMPPLFLCQLPSTSIQVQTNTTHHCAHKGWPATGAAVEVEVTNVVVTLELVLVALGVVTLTLVELVLVVVTGAPVIETTTELVVALGSASHHSLSPHRKQSSPLQASSKKAITVASCTRISCGTPAALYPSNQPSAPYTLFVHPLIGVLGVTLTGVIPTPSTSAHCLIPSWWLT